MMKQVYVDFPVAAANAEDAVYAARAAASHTTLEHALEKRLDGWETDWRFERVEVEGDDDPPSAMLVAA